VKAKLLVILALTLCSAVFITQFMAPMANAWNSLDVVAAASHYMIMPGEQGYNATIVAKYDITHSGTINLLDLVSMMTNYTGGPIIV
jgi:hypothetical protein